MRRLTFVLAVLAILFVSAAADAQLASNNPLITVNETGTGTLLFPGGGPIPSAGVLAADPGPGGLASALTYNLLGPPSLVAGDVFLLEPIDGTVAVLSDVIRFNPAGTGTPAYPASLVLYSDNGDAGTDLADTGFPTASYSNTRTFTETGPEGTNGYVYTPGPGDPGFVAGFAVTYNVISDAPVPEPTSLLLLATGIALTGRFGWRGKRK